MGLSIGIVGLPNVGKSTLFNALTKARAEASNYPFCTINPNVGCVKVPDERLEKIAAISKPKQILPTTVEFVDIAGLVKGAHKGEGLGNQFLANIRECQAICEVVRNFKDENIVHVDGKIDPQSDQETINTELIMADLDTVEKRLTKVVRDTKSGDKDAIKLKELLEKIKIVLEKGEAARTVDLNVDEKKAIKDLCLLTAKPIIYVLNTNDVASEIDTTKWDGEVVKLNIKQEEEIMNLEEADREEFIKELGLTESGLSKLIKASYRLLDLITFFTTGPDETRAWTTKKGSTAPQASAAIHTDFEKYFVRAEIINWEKFLEAGNEVKAKEKGWVKTEGKTYIMQDGDICNFLINK